MILFIKKISVKKSVIHVDYFENIQKYRKK